MSCDLRTFLAYAAEYDRTPDAQQPRAFVEHCSGLRMYVAQRLAKDRGQRTGDGSQAMVGPSLLAHRQRLDHDRGQHRWVGTALGATHCQQCHQAVPIDVTDCPQAACDHHSPLDSELIAEAVYHAEHAEG